jgi:N-terminal acetyltransferase B complex non-catalytic subunit
MSIKTYQINEEKKITKIITTHKNESHINPCLSERDTLISQLKSRIFELELHEKDYDLLNQRYNQLQNEIASLNESKNELECEKKMQEEELNNHISELQCENENLQVNFSEKLSENKNLFSQNNILGKQIDLKDAEIYELTAKLSELENQLNKNEEERSNLTKIINGLNDINKSQNYKISQLVEDNTTLKQICEEQDQEIKNGSTDRDQMAEELDVNNCNIQDLNLQIKAQVNNLNNLQNQLNKNIGLNTQYENTIKEYQRQLDILKEENDNLKNNLINEKSIHSAESQKKTELTDILNDREQKINQICNEIDSVKIMQQKEINNNNILQEENAKLRNHIMILTEQNQNLINEIDEIIEDDEKKLSILNRKDRISSILMNNRNTIDQSLNDLDACINQKVVFEEGTPDRNEYENQ